MNDAMPLWTVSAVVVAGLVAWVAVVLIRPGPRWAQSPAALPATPAAAPDAASDAPDDADDPPN